MRRLIILILLVSFSIATALANGCWDYSCSNYPSTVYTNVSYNYAATSQSFDSSRLLMCNNYNCVIVFEGAKYHRLYVETPVNLTVETLIYDLYGSDFCSPGHFGYPRLIIYYSGNYSLPNLAMGSNGAYTTVYGGHEDSTVNCGVAPHNTWIKRSVMLNAKGYYWIVPLRGTSNMKFSINMQSSCTPAYLNQSRCINNTVTQNLTPPLNRTGNFSTYNTFNTTSYQRKIVNGSCQYEWKTIDDCPSKNYNETEYYCFKSLIKQRTISHTPGCSDVNGCTDIKNSEEKIIKDCSEYDYDDEELYCDSNNLMKHLSSHNYMCKEYDPDKIIAYSASSSSNNVTFSCEEDDVKNIAVINGSDQLIETCENGCSKGTCLAGSNATFGFLPVAGTVDSKGAQGSDASTILFGGLATAAIAGGAAGTAMVVRSIKGRGSKPFSISVIQQSIDKIGKSLDNVAKAATLPPLPPFENIPFVSRRAEFEALATAEYEAERARIQQEAEWRRIDRMQRAQDVADRQALEIQMQQDAINDRVWLANYRAEQQRNQPTYRNTIPWGTPCMIDGMPADQWTEARVDSNNRIRTSGGIPSGYDYNPNSGVLTLRPEPQPPSNNTNTTNDEGLNYCPLYYTSSGSQEQPTYALRGGRIGVEACYIYDSDPYLNNILDLQNGASFLIELSALYNSGRANDLMRMSRRNMFYSAYYDGESSAHFGSSGGNRANGDLFESGRQRAEGYEDLSTSRSTRNAAGEYENAADIRNGRSTVMRRVDNGITILMAPLIYEAVRNRVNFETCVNGSSDEELANGVATSVTLIETYPVSGIPLSFYDLALDGAQVLLNEQNILPHISNDFGAMSESAETLHSDVVLQNIILSNENTRQGAITVGQYAQPAAQWFGQNVVTPVSNAVDNVVRGAEVVVDTVSGWLGL